VMDIAMPQLTGLEATRQIVKSVPGTKVLLLSAQSSDSCVQEAIESGAIGFLLKQTSARILATAIREVQKGNPFFSPSISRHLLHQYQKSSDGKRLVKNRSTCLSPREVEVLRLVAEGKANKQTAAELGIGISTVDKHRENLMRKLNIHDTASLTRYAINEGIIEGSVQPTTT
jgi:DNA-binding NarL/FixJ family response regulator